MSEAKCRRELIKAFMKPDKKSMKLHEALAELKLDGSNYLQHKDGYKIFACTGMGYVDYADHDRLGGHWLPLGGNWQVVEVGDE